ncbi:hypothetical protein SAMN06265379_10215 [Saccharicrinis carchari]|uniref:Uncharacterized protein n=1 Tax=Saccharicrinis carchari TaxID=1168039 RepID=A0A521BR57_SACCC|nr:hypothetical protein SAMN06265379_10215 [Saccharicrinis carchari]
MYSYCFGSRYFLLQTIMPAFELHAKVEACLAGAGWNGFAPFSGRPEIRYKKQSHENITLSNPLFLYYFGS